MWAVIEDVAEMCVTETTGNLGAHHSQATVDGFADILLR